MAFSEEPRSLIQIHINISTVVDNNNTPLYSTNKHIH